MDRIRKTGGALALAGLVFLLFLFVFEERLHIPSWLQVVGRMHPLLLHFPIVLLIISLLSFWIPKKETEGSTWELIRLFTALTALLSAIMGMLLSIEQADKSDTLADHKWMGTVLAVIAWALYAFHRQIAERKITGRTVSVISAMVLFITGHLGADLTHGEDFLLGPVSSVTVTPADPEKALIFPDIIHPILAEKCGGCHQGGNRKGGLSLNDSASIMAGGKTGKALIPGDLLKSSFISRLHLPVDDKKHMPLTSKPQLTPEEFALLEAWVKAGAPFSQRLKSRLPTDSLTLLANAYIRSRADGNNETIYAFKEADPATINKLNDNYRVIKQLGRNSPALAVSFFGRAMYSTEKLKELDALKTQIVELNLSKMPVTDEQVTWIATLPNLDRLNLNYSDITDQSLQTLAGMKSLRSLSVSGTAVSLNGLTAITANKNLMELFVWDSNADMAGVASLRQKNPQMKIETGFQEADTMVIALNKPLIKTTKTFFHDSTRIVLGHVIKNVDLRYHMDTTAIDSVNGQLYREPILITNDALIQVRAFKKGWLPSETVKMRYYKAGIPVMSTAFLTPPDPKYNGQADKVLTDLELGESGDFGTNWLGYMNNDAVVVFDLGRPQKVQQVRVHTLVRPGSSIFPPVSLTAWGSDDNKNWVLLNSIRPATAVKKTPNSVQMYTLHFRPGNTRYIKLQGAPIKKLPAWHGQKGKPGWFFMSEVILD